MSQWRSTKQESEQHGQHRQAASPDRGPPVAGASLSLRAGNGAAAVAGAGADTRTVTVMTAQSSEYSLSSDNVDIVGGGEIDGAPVLGRHRRRAVPGELCNRLDARWSTASCGRRRNHIPPDPDCRCGVYVYARPPTRASTRPAGAGRGRCARTDGDRHTGRRAEQARIDAVWLGGPVHDDSRPRWGGATRRCAYTAIERQW